MDETDFIKQEMNEALAELGAEKGTRIGLAILHLQLLHIKQQRELGDMIDMAYTKGYNDGIVNLPRNNPPKI